MSQHALRLADDLTRRDEPSTQQDAVLDGPVLATLLKLAAPTTAVLIAQALVGVAETWYVSFLGKDALAGVSLVFPILMLMTMMSNGGIGSGVASAVARAIGGGRKRDADAIVWHAVVLAVGFGLFFGLIAWLFGPSLYRALGGRGDALAAALAYSNVLFAGSIPFWTVNLLAAALRGSGNVRVPAAVTLTGSVLIVIVSPALIFGVGPVPAMGIAGAGVAMVAFYLGASLWLLKALGSGRLAIRLVRAPLDRSVFRDVMRVGLPTAASTIQPNLTVIVLTGTVGTFGIDAIAGFGTASRLDYLLVPILFGLGSAVLTLVGMNVGAQRLDRARRIAWVGAALGFATAGTIGLVVAMAPNAWLHIFSHDPAIVSPGTSYLRWVAPAYGLFGAGFVLGFAAQGAARVLWPFLAGTTRMLVGAGIGWIAVRHFGASLVALFAIVGASLVVFAIVIASAVLSGRVFRT